MYNEEEGGARAKPGPLAVHHQVAQRVHRGPEEDGGVRVHDMCPQPLRHEGEKARVQGLRSPPLCDGREESSGESVAEQVVWVELSAQSFLDNSFEVCHL